MANTIESTCVSLTELPGVLSAFLARVFKFPPTETRDKIESRFSLLKQDLKVYIEYPYVDSLYRNTFYNYFSTKHNYYDRNCVRLSFFPATLDVESLLSYKCIETSDCFGFICIRPQYPTFFGRGVLSPQAFKVNDFFSCSLKTEILVKGNRFKISGFPFTSQDNEYMVCSETTIWETVQYLGSKYPEYRTILPSEILKILSKYTPERDTPSHGLYPDQISYVLKVLGINVRIYNRVNYQDERIFEFLDIVHSYVDSAIPVIGILKSKSKPEMCHAVLYIGYKQLDSVNVDQISRGIQSTKVDEIDMYSFGRFINTYIICDDNKLIYQYANFSRADAGIDYKYLNYYSEEGSRDYELESFIVPLPNKVYLEASQAQKFISTAIKKIHEKQKIADNTDKILRVFFTTSRSFKNWILKSTEIDMEIKKLIIETTMPRFVYIGELSSLSLIKKLKANGIIIVDATQPEATQEEGLLFLWNRHILCYYDEIGSFIINQEIRIDKEFSIFKNFADGTNRNE